MNYLDIISQFEKDHGVDIDIRWDYSMEKYFIKMSRNGTHRLIEMNKDDFLMLIESDEKYLRRFLYYTHKELEADERRERRAKMDDLNRILEFSKEHGVDINISVDHSAEILLIRMSRNGMENLVSVDITRYLTLNPFDEHYLDKCLNYGYERLVVLENMKKKAMKEDTQNE